MKYENIVIFLIIFISFLISLLLYNIIIYIIKSKSEIEKCSAYECGFHPFEDTRQKFNIRFYLVAILFIIFDIEVIFLFPCIYILEIKSLQCYFIILIFLSILIVGFIYEWLKLALKWE